MNTGALNVNVVGWEASADVNTSSACLTTLENGKTVCVGVPFSTVLISNDTGISTNTNLGIGTTTASSALTVSGDGKFTGVVTTTTLNVNGTDGSSQSIVSTGIIKAGTHLEAAGRLSVNGNIQSNGFTYTQSTNSLVVDGSISDAAGNVRELVNNAKTAAYTLTANDVG